MGAAPPTNIDIGILDGSAERRLAPKLPKAAPGIVGYNGYLEARRDGLRCDVDYARLDLRSAEPDPQPGVRASGLRVRPSRRSRGARERVGVDVPRGAAQPDDVAVHAPDERLLEHLRRHTDVVALYTAWFNSVRPHSTLSMSTVRARPRWPRGSQANP